MNIILAQAFFEKIILLILTSLITGFGVPYVLKRIEERKLREQKKFEADLARQGNVIDAQAKLLDDLSKILWEWRYLAKKVVYYASEEDTERYELAKKKYEEDVWDILNKFRIEISRSRRLVSEHAYQKLDVLYRYIVRDVDVGIREVISSDKPDVTKSTEIANRFSNEVSGKLDDEIDSLASELELKVKT